MSPSGTMKKQREKMSTRQSLNTTNQSFPSCEILVRVSHETRQFRDDLCQNLY